VAIRRVWIRVGGAAAAFVATAGFAAACGGSTGNSAGAPTPAATDYLTCLKDNGVTIPQAEGSGFPTARPSGGFGRSGFPRPSGFPTARPSGGAGFPRGGGGAGGFFGTAAPSGIPQATWDKAQQACTALRPTAFPSAGNRGGRGGADTAYRNCLSQHGVMASGPLTQLNTADPQVAAAEQTCAVLKPTTAPSS
jgi:hypothetical protein